MRHTLILALIGLMFLPLVSSAQTDLNSKINSSLDTTNATNTIQPKSAETPNCVTYYNGLSAKTPPWNPVYVTPPAGCTGPIKTPIQAKPSGYCNWGDWPGAAPRPASAASPAWFPDQNRSSLWFWEREPNVPGTYDVNWGTCDLMLEWSSGPGYYCNRTNPLLPTCEYRSTGYGNTPYAQCQSSCKIDSGYYANITHRKVGQTEQKKAYQVGDKIEFVGATNVGGTNNRYSWNFSDNMWTSGTSLSYAPVIYQTPGIKKVDFKVTDATGQTYIATSTEVKVKCVPPAGAVSGDKVSIITTYLRGNQKVKIAADNLKQWLSDPFIESEVKKEIEIRQCEIASPNTWGMLFLRANRANSVIEYLKNSSLEKNAIPLAFFYTNQNLNSIIPDNDIIISRGGFHALIGLSFREEPDLAGIKYYLEVLDPGVSEALGTRITTLTCRKRQVKNTASQFNQLLVCQDPDTEYLFKNIIVLDPSVLAPDYFLSYAGVISNPYYNLETSKILRTDHLTFPNFTGDSPMSSLGVCAGWSDFALKVAYLAEFSGQCATTPTTPASVGLTDLSELLLKLREFLSGQPPLLPR